MCATLMKEKEQCTSIDTERFIASMPRCEYGHSWIVLAAPSLQKVRQGSCRGVHFSQLGWIWHCCWALPLAALFWPSIIPASCLHVGWPGANGICTPPFAGTLPCRSNNCLFLKRYELTGSPLFSCQYSRKVFWLVKKLFQHALQLKNL